MANTTTTRKKPRCHTCGGYMEGHRRHHGAVTCPNSPESSLISPPPSPEREPTASTSSAAITQPPTPNSSATRTPKPLRRATSPPSSIEFTPLPNGGAFRRNPNWDSDSAYEIPNITPPAQQFVGAVTKPPRPRNTFRAPSPTSTVSTVLVDDEGRTIYANDDDPHDDWETDSSVSSVSTARGGSDIFADSPSPSPLSRQDSWFSKVANYAKNNRFSVSILEADSDKEFDQYQRKAKRHGLHIEPINPLNPSFQAIHEEDEEEEEPHAHSTALSPNSSGGKKVLVIGTRASFVHQIASTGFDSPIGGKNLAPSPIGAPRPRHRTTSGVKAPSTSPEGSMNSTFSQHVLPPPSSTMSHFILPLIASIVGGCIVLYGMSFIPAASATQL
ncbi:hypothetical protein BKA70DRAFT_555722 [Coprinopsis sp. MPI-PUGE-AT-0042]|nr:hypothetical protein BKA70DRAFT_555722 [Coprinopsis sp. MPI-PUGE-AT-0042]